MSKRKYQQRNDDKPMNDKPMMKDKQRNDEQQRNDEPMNDKPMNDEQYSCFQSHPYGIQPLGNLFLQPKTALNIKSIGLGRLCIGFSEDSNILDCFGYFDAVDLCRICIVSRSFYVISHHEELWRFLVLKEFEGNFCVQKSWKMTYVKSKNHQLNHYSIEPLKIQGFYSDLLYQPYRCSSAIIESSWIKKDNIEKRTATSLTTAEFIDKYEQPNRPVVITDLVTKWKAFRDWNNEYLLSSIKNCKLSAGGYLFSFSDYINYANTLAPNEDQPLYIFDKNFSENIPQLAQDYSIPKYFEHDLFPLLKSNRPHFRWIIIGPKRSGSSFHIDPNATSAWNAVIRGRKKWILFPPHIIPPGVHPSQDMGSIATPVSLIEWFLNYYHTISDPQVIETIVEEGQIIFVPQGWWHLVLNLEDSIAITQNYVSSSNLFQVLEFFQNKQDQISGVSCHLRSQMHSLFITELQIHCPEIYAKAQQKIISSVSKKKTTQWTKKDTEFRFGFQCDE